MLIDNLHYYKKITEYCGDKRIHPIISGTGYGRSSCDCSVLPGNGQ